MNALEFHFERPPDETHDIHYSSILNTERHIAFIESHFEQPKKHMALLQIQLEITKYLQ
jgi:hypothetical protein